MYVANMGLGIDGQCIGFNQMAAGREILIVVRNDVRMLAPLSGRRNSRPVDGPVSSGPRRADHRETRAAARLARRRSNGRATDPAAPAP
jgi:hypothetical protein